MVWKLARSIFKCFMMACFLMISFYPADADEWYSGQPGCFTVYLSDGSVLFKIGRTVYVGDEYVSRDNKKYRIVEVDAIGKTAKAKYTEDIKLPDISDLIVPAIARRQNRTIGIYCTHSDESYLPSDGQASIRANGGILDVAQRLGEELGKREIKAVVDTTPHDPHDAGAYRRSRQTAFKIIKKHAPAALFDIHRDSVPKEEYIIKLNGRDITGIRIVVGRSNQNRQANESFAYSIKAVADKKYPGLIKDIFIGKGSYNQDLHPRSLLLEFGTYDHMKERALKATAFFAEVTDIALFGSAAKNQEVTQEKQAPAPKNEDESSGKGILYLFLFVLLGGGVFFFLSHGREERKEKLRAAGNRILHIKKSMTGLWRKWHK